ncbi:MAG: hypothetical protein K0S54_365 [Alphaproteobacteria bacterium]|jgi:hypothetical protein|nr:hypothetical protein [Alphaproteobacteria bacterium]
MPLRNRVTPFNDIVAVAARGTLMGNRGRLHDADRALGNRLYTTRSWVACVLEFKQRYRLVMQPGRYTELFFLDEPTSLAAGHRPCGQCRYADYHRFLDAWRSGNDKPDALLRQIDEIMHADRFDREQRRQKRVAAQLADLPDGTMVGLPLEPGLALLVWGRTLLQWSAGGYHSSRQRPAELTVEILTPHSTIKALAAGYRPMLHPTAEALI